MPKSGAPTGAPFFSFKGGFYGVQSDNDRERSSDQSETK